MDADPGARTKSLSSPILEKKKKRRKKASETTRSIEKVNISEMKSVAPKSLDFSAEKVGPTFHAVVQGKTCKRQKCSGVASRDSAASAGKDSGSAVVLGSVCKIQDPSSSSCYDSGARGRVRQIEEQTALSLALHHQRLQNRSARDSAEFHLREPREQEIRITLPAKQEPVAQQVDTEFPEITAEMEREINQALFGGSREEAVSDGFRMTVTRSDMLTLHGLNWLNDEIINFYMSLIMERSQEMGSPKVHAFNTFFFQKLKNAGYNSVRRWTKNVHLFMMDILLIPIHLGAHWCLAVIDFRAKSITYYDSMAGSHQDETCGILLEYLKQESMEKRGLEFEADGWILTSMKSQDIPQQNNGSDCGMFTCKYADYISQDREISFTQRHMPYFRKRMVWEILHKKLL